MSTGSANPYQPLSSLKLSAFGGTNAGGSGSTPVGLGTTVANNAMALTNQGMGIKPVTPTPAATSNSLTGPALAAALKAINPGGTTASQQAILNGGSSISSNNGSGTSSVVTSQNGTPNQQNSNGSYSSGSSITTAPTSNTNSGTFTSTTPSGTTSSNGVITDAKGNTYTPTSGGYTMKNADLSSSAINGQTVKTSPQGYQVVVDSQGNIVGGYTNGDWKLGQNVNTLTNGQSTPGTSDYNGNDSASTTGLIGSLANFNPTGTTGYVGAQNNLNNAISALNTSKQNEAQGLYDITGQPIPLNFQQGQAGQLQNKYLAQQNALQDAVNQYQTQLGYQLQGTSQQQGAMSTAAGLIPEALRYGSYSNTDLGSSLTTAGDINGRLSLSATIPQNKADYQVASSLGTSIQSLSSVVNPSDFTDVNAITQFLYGKVADPKYQALSNAISQFVNKIAPIVGTSVNDIALDIKGNGGNIMQTVNNLLQTAQANITAKQNIVGGTNNNVNTTPTFTANTVGAGSGGSTNPFATENFFN